VAGGVAALTALAAAGILMIATGLFDARAITPHGPMVGWAAHTTMIHAMRRRARDVETPARFTPAQFQSGFRLYDGHCVMCHGAPGVPRAGWTTGLTPAPPFLLDAARRWRPAELRLIVGDGVKMTAMPAWSTTLSSDEIWDIVAFTEALPGLSARDYARLHDAEQVGDLPQKGMLAPSVGRGAASPAPGRYRSLKPRPNTLSCLRR
jgi:mono/diheme cytochrome c family protein